MYQDTMHGAVLDLLEDVSDLEPEEGPLPSGSGDAAARSHSFDMEVDADDVAMVLDWATVAAQIGGDLTPSATHRAVTELATNMAEWLSTEHAPMQSDSSDSEPEPIEDELPDWTFHSNGEFA